MKNYTTKHLKLKAMENKKEPLMSYEDWDKQNKYTTLREHIKAYSNYHTQWHLNNAKEFVWNDFDIDKQSIHTAIDNYIKENL